MYRGFFFASWCQPYACRLRTASSVGVLHCYGRQMIQAMHRSCQIYTARTSKEQTLLSSVSKSHTMPVSLKSFVGIALRSCEYQENTPEK